MSEKPKMKDRVHPRLYQAYKAWYTAVKARKGHLLRISAIERGDTNLDLDTEVAFKTIYDKLVSDAASEMAAFGSGVGPIWDWLLGIKGIANNLAAKLLAEIDDIERCSTVSKLWRFAGWAVIDGKREYNRKGETSHYNNELKSVCWQVGDSFIKQQTPVYADLYYAEKDRLRRLHPDTLCRECKQLWDKEHKAKGHHQMYNPGHLHAMAARKMVKMFLRHLWLRWRVLEGLPISLAHGSGESIAR